jgi:hypothetical protein
MPTNDTQRQIERVEHQMKNAVSDNMAEMTAELAEYGIDAADWDFCQMYDKLEEIKGSK